MSPASHPAPPAGRPGLAIIANSHTPYRLHLHRRIARELTGLKLWSVYTHESSSGAAWHFEAPEEIGAISFGRGESSAKQGDPAYALREWRKAGRIIRWMRNQGVAAVLVMGYNDAGRLRIIRWCRRHGVPCFVFGDSNIRGDRSRGIKAALKRWVVGGAVRACSGVLCCGSLGRDYFLKYGADPRRIYYFPYEPDYGLIEAVTPADTTRALQRFSLDPARRRLVYSGRLAPEKRVDLLIDAFAAIAARRPEWNLLVIGDGPLRARLEQRVPTELRGRVTWTGFLDDQKVISALYRGSDALVLPSDYEPWAVVLTEAAAAGLAIVASDAVGAAVEVVRGGVNGRVFATGRVGDLTEALLDVTAAERTGQMKSASPAVLADWRRRGDPVAGLTRALADAGAMRASSAVGIETEGAAPTLAR